MSKVLRTLLAAAVLAALVVVLVWLSIPPSADLVVYTSVDAAYSRPLVAVFERETGLDVKLVHDAEAAKTTGLYQKLLAERGRPRADVFWNNEISRTLLLARKGLLAPYTPDCLEEIPTEFRAKDRTWYGLACRVRVIIYNTNLVKPEEAPTSVDELVKERWKGKAAMAYPLFGTTATHCAALRSLKRPGREKINLFFRQLVANKIRVVAGNSVVARMVADGRAEVGLTDTDDAWNMIDRGKPVKIVYPDQNIRHGEIGALVIPNTASLIAGAPHPQAARKFLNFLLSARAEAMLARPPSRHLPVRARVPAAKDTLSLSEIQPMLVDWKRVAIEIEAQARELGGIFPR
jgi:iron(III) transport system substrate-binding protein